MENLYHYDNREFHSLKQLAEYVGVNEKTITARLRRKMSIEEACNKTDLRCTYYLDDGVKKSITQICKEKSKDEVLVRNRLKYGYSLNEALNNPKKISKQGTPIVVNGIFYNSISSAIKQLNMSDKESTIRRRLRAGIIPDIAFQKEDFL